MTQPEQQDAFYRDLLVLTNRYRAEFQLTLSSAVGCLELAKAVLIKEQLEEL
jgi:hypothetical protein